MKRKLTPSERVARQALIELDIEYEKQHPIECDGKWYILDFYLWRHGICLEVDGLSHRDAEATRYDELRDRRLAVRGIRTVRVENEVMHNVMQAIHVIRQAIYVYA